MTVFSWLRLTIALWLLKMSVKVGGWLLLGVIIFLTWPVTATAALAFATAWAQGWPPARLGRAAVTTLALTAIWLGAAWWDGRRGHSAALAALLAWEHAFHLHPLDIAAAWLLLAPLAVPAGLALGALGWTWRIYALTTGIGGWTATAPVTFDARQWRHQVRSAKGRIAAPGAVPLLARGGMIPVGGTIRALGHPWQPVFKIPAEALGRHQVIIGATGAGKTNLMIRLWAGWFTATLNAFHAGTGHRPLLVVLDCKGGRDARKKAGRTRRLLYGAGARSVAIWPDQARLNLWDLPAPALPVLLYQMTETGTGSAAYYGDILAAVLKLAILAPEGPPGSHAEFLARLDKNWLGAAWDDGYHPEEAARVRAALPHLGDIQLRMATLLDRLGPALNGPGTLADADVWYFILEGTGEPSVAEAQAMALTELAAHTAASRDGQQRAIVLAADDYSAVSRRVPMSNLYERGRSLGIGVQVSAQSWHGLGYDEDERYRIAATADGGVWVMHTPVPEPLAVLAGTRRVLAVTHKLIGRVIGDEGSTRPGHAWTADPDLIRQLTVGQACYIAHGAATFVQVARPRPSPLTLLGARPALSRSGEMP